MSHGVRKETPRTFLSSEAAIVFTCTDKIDYAGCELLKRSLRFTCAKQMISVTYVVNGSGTIRRGVSFCCQATLGYCHLDSTEGAFNGKLSFAL